MRILVLTPVWRRPEITEAYCLGISRLRSKFNIDVLCVVSKEDTTYNAQLLDKYKIEYTYHPNKLGAKKNHGLRECMKKDFDYLMELNSDDIIKDELVEVYLELMIKGEPFIGLNNFVFYDSESGACKENKSSTLFGIGRAYSREALEQAATVVDVYIKEDHTTETNHYKKGNKMSINPNEVTDNMEVLSEPYYKLWDDDADRGMDNHSERVFRMNNIYPTVVDTDEPLAFDIKSEVNLWSFNQMKGESYQRGKLMLGLSQAEIDYLDAIRKD